MMFHRFVFGRLLALLLVGGLVFGLAPSLYRSGYRQGFTQGAASVAAGDPAATPPAMYGRPGGWGHGPRPFPLAGVALILGGALLLMGTAGRRRHMAAWAGQGGPWHDDPRHNRPGRGNPWHAGPWQSGPRAAGPRGDAWPAGGPIGPEKDPQDYV